MHDTSLVISVGAGGLIVFRWSLTLVTLACVDGDHDTTIRPQAFRKVRRAPSPQNLEHGDTSSS